MVTCIYDIERHVIDGREMNFYFESLSQLLNSYPETLVFHNCVPAAFEKLYPKAFFMRKELDELPLYKFKREIIKLTLNASKVTKNPDLVHRLPDYGIVINSKPYFIKQASKLLGANYYLWLDSGIARFYPIGDLPIFELKRFLLNDYHQGAFQIDLRNWFRNFDLMSLPKHWIKAGSSERIISGGIFLINQSSVNYFYDTFNESVEDFLDKKIWDTEQVNLFYVLAKMNCRYIRQRKGSPTTILDIFSEKSTHKINSLFDKLIQRILP